ncbi:uncharacterized protein LOC111360328 [Spodoptera litura]|uniref:Uncharacterized protein LOC111360328 n=1 Tax=Spodoptera litura TaxID=69820 RepID=A0A9J7EJT8_SPOLT|nr:uncharacterized protein LOC111360328 [Spodoptera litura]
MSVRLFISLVFITKILAADTSSQTLLPSPDHIVYNVHIPRKLVNEPIDEPPGGAAIPPNLTGIKKKIQNDTNEINKEKEDMEAQNSEAVISYPPYGSYQVTENVIDIPDNRTKAGPIDPYYTIKPELNLANATDTISVTEANNNKGKNKKNCVSIHIDAEFEREEIKENKVVGFLKGVKACFQSFQKRIIDGFYRFFHKNEDVLGDKVKY